jgi:hypothetical protein
MIELFSLLVDWGILLRQVGWISILSIDRLPGDHL